MRTAHQGIWVSLWDTGNIYFAGLVSAQDPASTSFGWNWSYSDDVDLPSIDTSSSPATQVAEGGFDFALVNGEWIGTGNFDITIGFDYELNLTGGGYGTLTGTLKKQMTLTYLDGLPVS